MTRFLSNRLSLIRYTLAATAGFLLTAAFPNFGVAGAAWIGPGLLLFSALGCSSKECFRLGFVGGLTHFLTSLYWLLLIPYTFHGVPLGPALGWFLLSAYVALYPAVWVWLCWKLFFADSRPAPLASAIDAFVAKGWAQRALWAAMCAAAWTGLEIFRGWFLSGFPWNFLGAAQYKILPLIQIASITGIYGVSFLVVWTSVALCGATLFLIRLPTRKGTLVGELILPLLAVAAVTSWGAQKVFSTIPTRREVKLALIQPSIPQTLIWDRSENANRFRTVLELSEQALAHKPDVLIWPESAMPEFSLENEAAIGQLVRGHKVWVILCADAAEAPSTPGGAPKYYNASFLYSPEGRFVNQYFKRRLVIFGEYIPLVDWLPFLKWFTPIEGGFTPGPGPVQFHMADLEATTSPLICFEDMFPQEARLHTTEDTDFLLNLTNDGWFGESAAQWQQAASAVFRSVENGVPLVRCTNNGLTCWVDAHGRIRQMGTETGSIYGAGYAIVQVPLSAERREKTFYTRHGDWFGWGCLGLTMTSLAASRRQKKTNHTTGQPHG